MAGDAGIDPQIVQRGVEKFAKFADLAANARVGATGNDRQITRLAESLGAVQREPGARNQRPPEVFG
jgi:hypothetical protein